MRRPPPPERGRTPAPRGPVDDDGRRPDGLEQGIRFGCGFTFGIVCGLYVALDWAAESDAAFWLAAGGLAVLLGFAAMYGGDRFWEGIGRHRRWW